MSVKKRISELKSQGVKVGRPIKRSKKFIEIDEYYDFISENCNRISLTLLIEELSKLGLVVSRATIHRYIKSLELDEHRAFILSNIDDVGVEKMVELMKEKGCTVSESSLRVFVNDRKSK
ncbi:hypothetical protein C1N51_27640 (plasmid) [Vibrio campbellii]|nr:hypothetical protein C1N51_27640 [Vibrio campbellii]